MTEAGQQNDGGGAPNLGGGDGGSAQNWRDSLPADLKAEKSLESFKDIGGLARSFVDTIKMRGAPASEFVRLPKDDAGWENALKALGRPDKADAYAWKRPEGAAIDEDTVAMLQQAAHKSGLLPRQYESLMSTIHESQKAAMDEQAQAAKEAMDQGVAKLKADWKDKYDVEVETAKRGYTQLFPEALREKIQAAGLANDPDFVRVMNNVGRSYKEDRMQSGQQTGFGARDLNTVKAERTQILGKLKGMDPFNSEHAGLQEKLSQLWAEEAELAYAQGYGKPKDLRQED